MSNSNRHEFSLISHYFQSPSQPQRDDVLLGSGDDAALLQPPKQSCLVVSTDTMVENIHFFPEVAPQTLGHKSLAVSVSDIAAMGADPAWAMLSLTLPEADETWLAQFSQGFFALLQEYGMQLIGGDLTRGPLSITSHVTGFVDPKKALRRNGAKVGDVIYVTGTLGDAGLALQVLQGKWKLSETALNSIRSRLETPTPRVDVGRALLGIASAAIDISDGLSSDLGHILEQSRLGATLNLPKLPLSPVLQELPATNAWALALNAGDDYELCFTVPPARESALRQAFSALSCGCQAIGVIEADAGLRLRDLEGQLWEAKKGGYEHF